MSIEAKDIAMCGKGIAYTVYVLGVSVLIGLIRLICTVVMLIFNYLKFKQAERRATGFGGNFGEDHYAHQLEEWKAQGYRSLIELFPFFGGAYCAYKDYQFAKRGRVTAIVDSVIHSKTPPGVIGLGAFASAFQQQMVGSS